MKNPYVMSLIVAIVVGGLAFFGGIKYQQSRPTFGGRQIAGANGGNRGFAGQRGVNGGLRPVMGEILSQDDRSITVKMQDGSSKIVILSTTTKISKTADTTKDDLKTGQQVAVFGIENSDGSVTAQNVQLNPQFRGQIASPSGSPR